MLDNETIKQDSNSSPNIGVELDFDNIGNIDKYGNLDERRRRRSSFSSDVVISDYDDHPVDELNLELDSEQRTKIIGIIDRFDVLMNERKIALKELMTAHLKVISSELMKAVLLVGATGASKATDLFSLFLQNQIISDPDADPSPYQKDNFPTFLAKLRKLNLMVFSPMLLRILTGQSNRNDDIDSYHIYMSRLGLSLYTSRTGENPSVPVSFDEKINDDSRTIQLLFVDDIKRRCKKLDISLLLRDSNPPFNLSVGMGNVLNSSLLAMAYPEASLLLEPEWKSTLSNAFSKQDNIIIFVNDSVEKDLLEQRVMHNILNDGKNLHPKQELHFVPVYGMNTNLEKTVMKLLYKKK